MPKESSLKHWFHAAAFRLVIYTLTAYMLTGAFVYFRQSALIFPAPKVWPKVTPAQSGLQFEDLQIPVTPTERVHSWWIPANPPDEKVLLMLHGNGYVLEDMIGEELIALHQVGTNVLAVDYRGYGLSTSIAPNELSLIEDARAALAYLTRERNIASQSVFVLGRSIGSGPAMELARENKNLGGLILETPLISVDAVASTSFQFLRFYPLTILLHTHFDNLSKIGSVQMPLLIVAGTADTLTPLRMAQALYAKARPPKELYVVQQANHDDLTNIGGTPLIAALRKFVHQTTFP